MYDKVNKNSFYYISNVQTDCKINIEHQFILGYNINYNNYDIFLYIAIFVLKYSIAIYILA